MTLTNNAPSAGWQSWCGAAVSAMANAVCLGEWHGRPRKRTTMQAHEVFCSVSSNRPHYFGADLGLWAWRIRPQRPHAPQHGARSRMRLADALLAWAWSASQQSLKQALPHSPVLPTIAFAGGRGRVGVGFRVSGPYANDAGSADASALAPIRDRPAWRLCAQAGVHGVPRAGRLRRARGRSRPIVAGPAASRATPTLVSNRDALRSNAPRWSPFSDFKTLRRSAWIPGCVYCQDGCANTAPVVFGCLS